MKTVIQKTASFLLGAFMVLPAAGYSANLAQRPLSIGEPIAHNVMFMLDDSSSMTWEFMPDGLSNLAGTAKRVGSTYWNCSSWNVCQSSTVTNQWYYSSQVNKVYFDPGLDYDPPFRADGKERMPKASYTSAPFNGYSSQENHRNLSASEFDTHYGQANYLRRFDRAFYYRYDSACGDERNNSCYTYVNVNNEPDATKQKFANWYTYYRNRMYASRAGIAEAFMNLTTETFRLGWGGINQNSGGSTIDGASGVRAVTQGVRSFTTAHREAFLTYLYNTTDATTPYRFTPLRRALEGAGRYYENSGRAWTDNPESSVGASNPELECRLSSTILMTDGYETLGNSYDPEFVTAHEADLNGPAIDGEVRYFAEPPFSEESSRTRVSLADVATHFWKRDLRPNANRVSSSDSFNPAFWQHMVTIGVGLGVEGSVDPVDAFAAARAGTEVQWWGSDSGGANDVSLINDLLHAAVNSRGGFFSASNPDIFRQELVKVLSNLTGSSGSSTSVEVAGDVILEGALIFSAAYDPEYWSGDLRAAVLGGPNSANAIPDFSDAISSGNGWSAADKLDARNLTTNDRAIITYHSNEGKPFRWANNENNGLNDAQKNDLSFDGNADLGQARLAYLRGDRTHEADGTVYNFRARGSRLGTIVNSSPNFVGVPSSNWPNIAPFGESGKRYSAFRDARSDRTPVVYAGANDGMLHGFNASENVSSAQSGQEVLAYVPSFVYSAAANQGLHYLTNPNFDHRFYVDLQTRKQDVYIRGRAGNGNPTGSPDWRTVLVGGGRAGAKGIFALDVTNPANFAEANAAQLALWEFTAANDARLGYVTQAPVVAMSDDGGTSRWSVFLPNGYGSDTASTGLFVLNFEGGLNGWTATDYEYVEFKNGGGGLSSISVLDTTGDYLADRVYAGDLDGNIWVAKVSDGSWQKAYDDPLFTAEGPITGGIAVGANRTEARAGNEPNLMVYFGTGKYMEVGDEIDTTTRAFYGVWDNGTTQLDEDDLLERVLDQAAPQTIDGQQVVIRNSSGSEINFGEKHGWYADLPSAGERVISTPIVRGDYVFINTIIPSGDVCGGTGSGWIMAFERMGGLVADNSLAFKGMPADTQGYRVEGGMPSQIVIKDDTLLYDISGADPESRDLPPLGGDVPGIGRRGWHELVE